MVEAIEKEFDAVSSPEELNKFQMMTDREIILELYTKCMSFEVPLLTDFKNEIKLRVKNI